MAQNTTSSSGDRARKVRLARSRALRLVPVSGRTSDLVTAVARSRERTVHLIPCRLAGDFPSGVWVATDEADYIVYREDASSSERTVVICHELAHMLLGHEAEDGHANWRTALAMLIAPDIDPAVAARFFGRHGYRGAVEAEAEHLGTLLATQLARNAEAYAVRRDSVSERLR